MKIRLSREELREPRSDLRRPSRRDEELEEAKRLLKPKTRFDEIRKNAEVKTFKK